MTETPYKTTAVMHMLFIFVSKNAAIAIYLSLQNPNEASYIDVDANNFFCLISISSTTLTDFL
jgi:hypothetical protein